MEKVSGSVTIKGMIKGLQIAVRKLHATYFSSAFHFTLIGVGLALRLWHYFENRSLWLDEAYVAVQILSKTWQEIFLFYPILDGPPQSPLGFMVVEKALTDLCGSSELVLRLFPLICGSAALVLFYVLLKRFTRPAAVGLALTLFAFNPRLIYYSAELKTYSMDVLVSLALLIAVAGVHRHGYRPRHILGLGLFYASAVWFSFPSIFFIASIGIGFLFIKGKRHSRPVFFMLVWALWLINVYALFRLCFQHMVADKRLLNMWAGSVWQGSIISFQAMVWLKTVILDAFQDPMAVNFAFITPLIFLAGSIVLIRRQRLYFYWLILPVIFVLGASLLGKYPFQGRMLLFLMPAFLLVLAEGVTAVASRAKRFSALIAIVLSGLLLTHPLLRTWGHFRRGFYREDNRQAMSYLKQNYQPGDLICLNKQAFFPFYYYSYRLGFIKFLTVKQKRINGEDLYGYPLLGKFDEHFFNDENTLLPFVFARLFFDEQGRFRKTYRLDVIFLLSENQNTLRFLGKRRVWLVFLHEPPPSVKKFILNLFARNGARMHFWERQGASVYVFDLARK